MMMMTASGQIHVGPAAARRGTQLHEQNLQSTKLFDVVGFVLDRHPLCVDYFSVKVHMRGV